MAMHWYVLHVYSGFEKKVAEGIREQAEQKGMEDLFEQVLVPTEEVVEMRRGQKVNAERKRSEEHTSELQSLMRISYAVFCLKKKKTHSRSRKSNTSASEGIKERRQNTEEQ